MKNSFIYVTFISIAVISFPYAYGIDIIATPEKDPFGPNDWIRIFLEIATYKICIKSGVILIKF